MARLLWLADVLRGAGLTVHEVPGWQTRSAAEDTDASTYQPRGVIIHETRAPRIVSDAAEIGVLVNGRVGLSGPIAQLYLGRDGHWHVVAAGLCHHVRTGWGGPFKGLGNNRLLGIEAAHTVSVDAAGRRLETWAGKPVQYASYVRGVAAIRAHTGWSAPVGHKEHQPGDKPDPEFDMSRFRAQVGAAMAGEDDDMFEDADRHALLVIKNQIGSLLALHDTWTSPGGSTFGNLAAQQIKALRAELAAARAEEQARDAAQTALIEGLSGLSGATVTPEQLAELTDAVADAAAITGERVLAELRRQEAQREAGLAAQLAAETSEPAPADETGTG